MDGRDLLQFVSLFPREGSTHLKPGLPKAGPSVIWSSAVGPEYRDGNSEWRGRVTKPKRISRMRWPRQSE